MPRVSFSYLIVLCGASAKACRMFALEDLAFNTSVTCPGGGYSSVLGRYSKRHLLLFGPLKEKDVGDPIYTCTAPFETIHKEKTRPAFLHSTKHSTTVAKHILQKVRKLGVPMLTLDLLRVLYNI